VIVYDQRGTGKSDKPEQSPYTTQMFAQDAIAVLDTLGIDRAHVYGASMGGLIVQWIAINYPERVGALVLGCTHPGKSHLANRSPQVEAIISGGQHNPRMMFQVLSLFYSPWWFLLHLNQLRSMGEDSTPMPPYAEQFHAQASTNHDAWDLLPTITAPTLVIHGSKDRVTPVENAYALAERIPNAELYIVKGGRHIFFWEFRKEASRVVNDFLARHPFIVHDQRLPTLSSNSSL
jgi:pimeloyl-ACP methyl ester carboxylesterase